MLQNGARFGWGLAWLFLSAGIAAAPATPPGLGQDPAAGAREAVPVQVIGRLSPPVSLKSQPGVHTWWARPGALDPERVTRDELASLSAGGATHFDRPVLRWTPVAVPADLHAQPHFMREWKLTDGVRTYWYRKVFVLPERPEEQVALRLGVITDSDRVYLNGRVIGATGVLASHRATAYDRVRLYSVPRGLLRPGHPNVLLVESRNYFPHDAGIMQDQTRIGTVREIFAEVDRRAFLEIFFLICYATVGLYFLFLFVRRRKERENFFFALFCLGLVVYQLFRNQLKYEISDDFLLMKRLEYATLFLLGPAYFYFTRYFFDLPRSRLVRAMDWITAAATGAFVLLVGLVLLTDEPRIWHQLNVQAVQQVLWPVLMLSSVGIILVQALRGHRDAQYMLAGTLVVLGAIITDVLVARVVFNFPRVIGFAFFALILALAVILANRFVRVNEAVEDLNRNLEKKVRDRTRRLRRTLTEVQALKEQQDGDYFLTSLLVNPLSGDASRSETVHVELYARQKKHFQFRHRADEIGGDLNSAHTIHLKGRSYTAVLNADAMGKSIQGAGGALVMGTVFKSIIARTQKSREASELTPEGWLRHAFEELNGAFLSFDGSMLVSLVLALVDDADGTVHFLNAEHPRVVLYRDGQARFVDESHDTRKIGIAGVEETVRVQTFEMLPGDVVFLGSDGRDDLLIGEDAQGRIINEDQTVFLRCVEEGAGELEAIVEALRRRGEFTDDLSLVRISYKEPGHFP